jgi:hypothetical protein
VQARFSTNQKTLFEDKTVDIMAVRGVEEVKVSNNSNKEGAKKTGNLKVRVVNGQQYLVHPVLINDTLSMLSLKYNVS